MGRLIFGMMQSLDGYVAGAAGGPGREGYLADVAAGAELPPPGAALGRHFNEYVRGLAGCVYGRRIYEIMRYWEEDQPDWEAGEREFAAAWRAQPKWIVSRTLKSVGPNATLVRDGSGSFFRSLKADIEGSIDVAGPDLAGHLTDLGLIDEYRLYLRPVVLGRGKPFFARARPPLRLIGAERIAEEALWLTYIPA